MKLKKTIASISLIALIMQTIITIVPKGVLAVENAEEQSKEENQTIEIGREYEIKEEETWDVSEKQDGSVMAKWTLKDRTLVISGNGEMRYWDDDSSIDWHNNQYTKYIEKVIIENGVTSIGKYAFYECSSLTNIIIPEGVTSIGDYAFNRCSSLTNITIPEGVTSIEDGAFEECSSLTNITIPEGVTSIGDGAFEECSSLTNITIPEGVTSIGVFAFDGCSSLENINVNINNKKYMSEKGILFNKDKTEIICYPEGKKDSQEYIIPEGVTSIVYYAFSRCSSLTNITIPEGVTSIGNYAFEYCSSLTNITIPEGVTSIEDGAFEECSSLTNITIPEGVTSIGVFAFDGCSSLTRITIPEGVTSIGNSAFSRNTILNVKADSKAHEYAEENGQGYFLEGKPTVIKTDYEIKKQEEWDISKKQDRSVIARWRLEDRTLVISGNGKMKDWNYNERNIDWHDNKYTNIIEKVIIEKGIISVGSYAFDGCSSLTNITIPEGVTSIGSDAFSGCSSLTNITIPEGVTSIGNSAFSSCSSLTNITIPEGVTSIGSDAFSGCSSLTNITIPEGVTSIGSDAFSGCSSLENINVNINNKNYMSEKGILFNKDKTEIICYPEGKKESQEYIIPEGVTSIGDYAFNRCSSLANITIPKGVTSIGYYAFNRCSSLTNITIPEGVTSIESDAFSGCSSLTNITIPEGVTSIKSWTFDGCSSLTNIIIPEGVTSIGREAFDGCSSLTNIIIPEGITSIGREAFDGVKNIIIKRNTEGHRYAEDEKVGYIIDEEGPEITYTPNGSNTPQKQYQIKINVKDIKTEVNENSLKYQWTQSTETPSKESFKDILKNGQTITKNNGDGIWYLWVYAKDKVGNEIIKRSEGYNFDNTAPKVEIQYSSTNPTNENVIVIITSNEEMQEVEGWKMSENKNEITKEYAENTEETIILKDKVGNQTEVKISIKNIDPTLPEIQIGDINGDKRIDITDLLLLKRHLISSSKEDWKLTEEKLQRADINKNGNVDITDLIMLKKKILIK